ncbi:MAG: hypothetical protein KDD60_02045 [Bdellovibrionales bacterium]|nr:hypothetical protein [Bdellovibrionales bacterium]
MGQYRPPVELSSMTRNIFTEEEPHGALWLIFFVYIPVILLVFAIRAFMLVNGVSIISINIIDPMVLSLYQDFSDLFLIATGQ